ncbi:hypothetical protein PR048_012333 [Dryococelus australis]|uniref:CMP domain-containing protein n=1 Tax=Dryococelus australis TaxID=614101 RepID=A0ABQ9HP18_9NEOP|nr:hypothetical protein PR048_012333 [Dryococelus australis]
MTNVKFTHIYVAPSQTLKRSSIPYSLLLSEVLVSSMMNRDPVFYVLESQLVVRATVAERLGCSPPTKANQAQSPAGSLRILACDKRAVRCHSRSSILISITLIGSKDLAVRAAKISSFHFSSRGSVIIKNWKPLSFDKIADGPSVTVGDILGELTTVATLRIQLYRDFFCTMKSNAWSTVTERLACSRPTNAIRVKSPAGSLRIFPCGNRAGRCRWLAGFLGDLPFPPPFHSDAAPYSPQSPSSALKTSMLSAVQISSLTHSLICIVTARYIGAPVFGEQSSGQVVFQRSLVQNHFRYWINLSCYAYHLYTRAKHGRISAHKDKRPVAFVWLQVCAYRILKYSLRENVFVKNSARPTVLSEMKEKLLRLLIAKSHNLLLSSGCPLDELQSSQKVGVLTALQQAMEKQRQHEYTQHCEYGIRFLFPCKSAIGTESVVQDVPQTLIQLQRRNFTVLYALEPASFLHWLLQRCEDIPSLTELHVSSYISNRVLTHKFGINLRALMLQSLETGKIREFNDLQARLRSLLYKCAGVNCALVV